MRLTIAEIDYLKYNVCCPMCDLMPCVKGTEKCDAEIWKKAKLKEHDEQRVGGIK